MNNTFLLILISMFLNCKNPNADLEVVKELDLTKYAGTWYEIARLSNSFERKLECATATYSLKDNNKVEVVNKGHYITDHSKTTDIKGTAWVPDKEFPAKLKVRFFWPFSGDYWVLELDSNYQYALIGEPSRKYLWILSKTKTLDDNIYNSLLESAAKKGFDIKKIIKVKQDC